MTKDEFLAKWSSRLRDELEFDLNSILGVSKVAAPAPEIGPEQEWERRMLQLAAQQHISARPDTLRTYIKAWKARGANVEQMLMDSWTPGKTIMEIQEHFFGNGKATNPFKAAEDWAKGKKA